MLGNGDGTSTLTQSISQGCGWVTAADFNKDGNPDVAVGMPSQAPDSKGNQVIVYLGDGHGGIASQVINGDIDFVSSIDGSPCAIDGAGEAADFNGDKLPDIVITANCTRFQFNSSVLLVSKGDGSGHFTFHKNLDFSRDAGQHVHLADVYQDGRIELVGMFTESFPFANDGVTIVAFAHNDDGDFFSVNDMVHTNTSESFGDTITGYTIADVDGDGIKDVIVGVHTSNTDAPPDTYSFRIFKGHADHTYTLLQSSSLAGPISDMAWGDFDKNSRVDLALIRPASTDVWLNTTASSIFCGVTGLRLMNFCDTSNGPGVFHFVSTTLDNQPVNAIQIYVDGIVKFVTPDDLLNVNIPIPDGKHRVTVKAWDDQGPFSATTFVTSCPNSSDRTVRICSPADGMTIDSSGTTHLLASAATNLKFNVLQLYIDGSLARDDLSQTIDLPLAMGRGKHRITVKGWDGSGQFSSTVTVNVR